MWKAIRHAFTTGLVIVIPVVITVWVLVALFNAFDRIIAPLLVRFGVEIPGLGFVAMVVLILVVGVLSRNLAGKFLVGVLDGVISKIPLARTIYSAVRDVMKAFSVDQQGRSFRQVVLVEYPKKGIFSIGFVTNEISWKTGPNNSMQMISVYFPHPPNPTSGVMALVPRKDVMVLDLSVEEGLKLALSGGIVAPEQIASAKKSPGRRTTTNR